MVVINDYTQRKPEGEVQGILSFAAQYLGISEANITVIHRDDLLEKFSSGGVQYDAATFQTSLPHGYNCYIRRWLGRCTLRVVLCHECVHVKQQEAGELKVDLSTGKCLWKGKEYGKDYPYNLRPWEQEAFRLQNEILRAYKMSLKKF